jgi:hypothetical protein
MADIQVPITYSLDFRRLIEAKLSDPTFAYQDWSNDDLLDLRRFIRDYYRDVTKKCTYCKKDVSLQSANNCHVEHIIPKSLGIKKFIFEPKNLCVICSDCNEIKRNKEVDDNYDKILLKNKPYKSYPRSSDSFLIVHPHFDNYEDHIFKCGDIYIDLTSKGSYTMYICKLNRKIHKFGIEPILLDKSELFDLFNDIMNEKNFTRQTILFNKLRAYFITTS